MEAKQKAIVNSLLRFLPGIFFKAFSHSMRASLSLSFKKRMEGTNSGISFDKNWWAVNPNLL